MKILLDHNLDWRLRRYLIGHEVTTADEVGWEAFKNGELLRNALNLTMWQAHTYTQNLMAHAPIPTMRYAPSCQSNKAGETIDAT